MRPLKLTMVAFGPYASTQVIDFAELKENRLFLITGATGAGKTTIFDGICYALYGESSGDMRTIEGLRSHFSSEEQRTEVGLEFSMREKHYSILRIPKQLRKKERGEGYREIPSKVEMIVYPKNNPEKKVVYTSVKEVDECLLRDIGLNVTQFKQILMIPQGEFRKLLTASSQEREIVLNQLFDTRIYQWIQLRMENERKELAKTLDTILSEKKYLCQSALLSEDESHRLNMALQGDPINMNDFLAGIDQLDKEDAFLQATELGQLNESENQLKQRIAQKQLAIKSNEKLTMRDRIKTNLENHKRQESAIQSEVQSLEKNTNAQKIMPIYTTLQMAVRSKDLKKEEIEALKSNIIKQKVDLNAVSNQLKELTNDQSKQENQHKLEDIIRLRPLLMKVQKLEAFLKNDVQIETNLKIVSEQLRKYENDLSDLKQKEAEAIERVEKYSNIEQKLSQHKIDEAKLQFLKEMGEKLIESYNELKVLERENQTLTELVMSSAKVLQVEENILLSCKRDYYLSEAIRISRDLKVDEMCPVCGSKEHPYLAFQQNQHLTVIDQKDIEKQELVVANVLKKHHKNQESLSINVMKISSLTKKINEEHKQFSIKLSDFKTTNPNSSMFEQTIDCVVGNSFDSISQCVLDIKNKLLLTKESLIQFENKKVLKAHDESYIVELTLRQKEQLDEINRYKQVIKEQEIEKSKIFGQITEIKQELPDENTTQESLQKKIIQLTQETETFSNAILEYESSIKLLEEHLLKDQQRVIYLESSYNELLLTIETSQKKLTEGFVQYNFSSIEAYESSLLDDTAMQHKTEIIRNYYDNKLQLEQSLSDLERELQNTQWSDINNLDCLITEIEQQNTTIHKRLNFITNRMLHNNTILSKLKELNIKSSSLEEKYGAIGGLARVANGRNPYNITFERFVLAQFLVDVIKAANIRLKKMTGHRYYLQKADSISDKRVAGGLDLEIFDEYTGKSRPVRTLSGGETFKASLSMALGLADVVQSMAGGVQLDTMFIDEGFGTLDPDSLDQAITCLIDLQNTGRVIGIISHVPELKERIPCRLEVSSTQNGSSARFVI